MDKNWLERTQLIVGEQGIKTLSQKHVLIVGLGGVGSFAAELIARSGIGKLTIVDGDVVDLTNTNRQLPALHTTVGESKAELMAQRIRAINPKVELTVLNEFLTPERIDGLLETPFDYVVDCIDSLLPKLTLLASAYHKKYPIVSSMGAGGKRDVTKIKVTDLYKTENCKLARYVRKRLKKRGVKKGVKAIYSTEIQDKDSIMFTDGTNFKKSAYGTMSYMPATFGCFCASTVINDLLQ